MNTETAAKLIQLQARLYLMRAYRFVEHSGGTCCVCLDDTTRCVRMLGCNHVLHLHCALCWFKHKSECPMCRRVVVDTRTQRAEALLTHYEKHLSLNVDVLLGMHPDAVCIEQIAQGLECLPWETVSANGAVALKRAYNTLKQTHQALRAFALLQRLYAINELREAMSEYDGQPFRPIVRIESEVWTLVCKQLRTSSVVQLGRPSLQRAVNALPPCNNRRTHARIIARVEALEKLHSKRSVLLNSIHLRKNLLERIVSQSIRLEASAGVSSEDVVQRIMSMQTIGSLLASSPSSQIMIEGVELRRARAEAE